MEKLLIFFIILASTVEIWANDAGETLQERSYRNIQYAMDNAVHAASLKIDKELLGEGTYDFKETEALSAARETLYRNLPLQGKNDLSPTHTYYFSEPIEIVDIVFIDDNYVYPLTGSQITSYPFNYKYENPAKNIEFERAIFGQSVVLVIQTTIVSEDSPSYFISIEEYKS